MLKVFVPIYDIPTQDNGRLANDVFPNSPSFLVIGSSATRIALQTLIANEQTTALFVLAHGDRDCLLGQNGEVALNISDIENNLNGVLRLSVFAWACRTSLNIGKVFHKKAQESGAWWGYRTTVSAPNPHQIGAFRDVITYIKNNFHSVKNESEGKVFFDNLKDICERHRTQVVNRMSASRDYCGAHEIAVGLREVWAHLDAMLPTCQQPLHADIFFEPVVDGV